MSQIEPQKDPKRIVVELAMSVDEARRTLWQISPRKPIGELLDSNELTYRDLAWAVKAAYDPKVRAASQTLLAYWIGQPATIEATRRYGPKVIAGSEQLEEKEREKLIDFTAWGMGTIFVIVVLTINFFQQYVITAKEIQSIFPILNIAFGVGAILLSVRKAKQHLEEYRDYRGGRRGEESVIERLRSALDHRWTIFRNLHLPGHIDDLDIVLVGPGGVWTLEVKAFHGTIRVQTGDIWERQDKNKWKRLESNPTAQVKRNAQQLNSFLRRQGIAIRWVETAVALAEPQPITNFDSSSIPIWLPPTIEEQVAKLTIWTPPTEKEIEQIVAQLTSLAEKQLAIENAKKQA